ncbi:hypothetical protein [Micromonospora sp. NPDC005707]|uniref:hypothetical protein n=1 Tax=Micromonospora sp. NPDC005707 TaxID=3157050 RepID=UPI003406852D
MSLFEAPFPAGLPVGGGWVPAPTAPVRFPYDGSAVAEAPLGDAELARTALDAAEASAYTVARLPSHVRRAALLHTRDALAAPAR